MDTCKFQGEEICDFIECCKRDNCFATICEEKDAEFVADGEAPLYFRFCPYSNDDIERIMSQTEQWQIKCKTVEDWDPSFGYTPRRVEHESVEKVNKSMVLVQDGNFAGVVDYSRDSCGRYGLFYSLTSNYVDTPLHFSSWDGYGSSDHDMMYKHNYYLQKR